MLDLWNFLHESTIFGIEGSPPDDVKLTLKVPYLSDQKFVITMHQCALFEWHVFGKDQAIVVFTDLDTIAKSRATIHRANIINNIVQLHLSGSVIKPRGVTHPLWRMEGELYLKYNDMNIWLDDGTAITIEELKQRATLYWEKR